MDTVERYVILCTALLIHQLLWFGVSVIKQRNDVADVAWGLGFILLAWLSFVVGAGSPTALWVNGMITVWGMRLALHIGKRNQNKPEDFRYAQWRKAWRHVYWRSFWQVFMLQGCILFIVAWPVMAINFSNHAPKLIWIVVGAGLWVIGFAFEAVADYQLAQFKKYSNHAGKLIQSGLWRYSRHPNYFGEAVQWWGIFVIAYPNTGWWALISPMLITYLLRYVSGVPLLERKYSKHPDFADYQRKTSVFFPWLPKKV